ncbi:MAG: DsbA family protein [Candidatus Dadabacteria bacterium]|nr:MAG: DsbA family protein [Candidatus Dadabacteria bacterium]
MARLIYITDPMCSWCYAFGPVVRVLDERHDVRVVTGGLRPFTRQAMAPEMAAAVVHHWHQVGERSGRPVRTDFFERHPAFVYDTARPSRAWHAARQIAPDRALAWLDRLQIAFYAEGLDPTAQSTWETVANECDIDPDELMAAVHAPESERAMLADFEYARGLGIQSFPTLLADCGERPRLVAMGFTPLDAVEQALEGVLARYAS